MNFDDMRTFGYHQMMHPDEIAKFQKGLAEAAANGKPYISEMQFKNKEGKYIWHLNIASPVLDESGNITMWVGSTTDIQSLKEEEQRKNDFIGMVSHELKTPITSVNLYLQLLLKKAEKAEDDFLTKVYTQSLKQIKYMTDMINGFLDVSRLESSKLMLENSDFAFAELIDEVREDYHLQYPSHRFVFEESPAVMMHGDRLKIAQVLNNIVGNAVKYSESGSSVYIWYRTTENKITVIIKDEGTGIKQENLKNFLIDITVWNKKARFPDLALACISVRKLCTPTGAASGQKAIMAKDLPFILNCLLTILVKLQKIKFI